MRVAAIYDIHGNLPALEAIPHFIRKGQVEFVVVGGDVVQGTMVRETLSFLLDFNIPVRFLLGNGEINVLTKGRSHDARTVSRGRVLVS